MEDFGVLNIADELRQNFEDNDHVVNSAAVPSTQNAATAAAVDPNADILKEVADILKDVGGGDFVEPPVATPKPPSAAAPPKKDLVDDFEVKLDDLGKLDLFGDKQQPESLSFSFDEPLEGQKQQNIFGGSSSSGLDVDYNFARAKENEFESVVGKIADIERDDARATYIEQITELTEELSDILPNYKPPELNIATASIADLKAYYSILSRKYEGSRFGSIGSQALYTLFRMLESAATSEKPLFGFIDLTGLSNNGRRVIQRNQSQISRGISRNFGGYLEEPILGTCLELGIQILMTGVTNAARPKNATSADDILKQIEHAREI